jgi:hypothetical protein
MRLYPKRLRSMDDLVRERRALQRELKQMDEEELLSVEGLLGKKDGGGDVFDTIIDLLPVSNPLVKTGIGIVKDVLKKRNAKAKSAENKQPQEKKGPGIVARAAREFIGGYIKWKAVELSFKGLRYLVNRSSAKS